MSHELRTPMNAIIGYSEMLIEEVEEAGDSSYLPDLQKIRTAGKHLLALINDVLDFSKIEAGKMDVYLEKFEILVHVARRCVDHRAVGRKNGNRLEFRSAEGLGSIQADLTKVRQALLNLLSNCMQVYEQRRYHADGDTRDGLRRRLAAAWRQRYRDRNFVGTNDKAL